MTLLCVGSAKGAPGATLTALGLAAAWPVADPVRKCFIEADPAGGAVAIRYGMSPSPGLLSLAAQGVDTWTDGQLFESTQRLPGGLSAILSPDRPDQVTAALRSSGLSLAAWLAGRSEVVSVADVGRLSLESPAAGLVSNADACLLVARPVADQLQPGAHLLSTLSSRLSVGWILVGTHSYSAADVERAYGHPVVAELPDDRRAARALETGSRAGGLRRTLLVRGFGQLAEELARHLSAEAQTTTVSR